MSYLFKTDINIEYLFFTEMVERLQGKKSKTLFNGREKYQVCCPNCEKRKAVMGYARRKDTFVLACPVDGCGLKGIVLHEVIKRYGGSEMFERWRKARWTSTDSNWMPIKNPRKNN